jgi:hypothetical protein
MLTKPQRIALDFSVTIICFIIGMISMDNRDSFMHMLVITGLIISISDLIKLEDK